MLNLITIKKVRDYNNIIYNNYILLKVDKSLNFNSKYIVPGDIIQIHQYLKVPCDVILLDGLCNINESHLTGVNNLETKIPLERTDKKFNYLESYKSIIFEGSTIVNCEGIVNKDRIIALAINTNYNTFYQNLLLYNNSLLYSNAYYYNKNADNESLKNNSNADKQNVVVYSKMSSNSMIVNDDSISKNKNMNSKYNRSIISNNNNNNTNDNNNNYSYNMSIYQRLISLASINKYPNIVKFYIHIFIILLIIFSYIIISTDIEIYNLKNKHSYTLIAFIFITIFPIHLVYTIKLSNLYSHNYIYNKSINCGDISKLSLSGKVNYIIFDKTGTLTEDRIDLVGFHCLVPDYISKQDNLSEANSDKQNDSFNLNRNENDKKTYINTNNVIKETYAEDSNISSPKSFKNNLNEISNNYIKIEGGDNNNSTYICDNQSLVKSNTIKNIQLNLITKDLVNTNLKNNVKDRKKQNVLYKNSSKSLTRAKIINNSNDLKYSNNNNNSVSISSNALDKYNNDNNNNINNSQRRVRQTHFKSENNIYIVNSNNRFLFNNQKSSLILDNFNNNNRFKNSTSKNMYKSSDKVLHYNSNVSSKKHQSNKVLPRVNKEIFKYAETMETFSKSNIYAETILNKKINTSLDLMLDELEVTSKVYEAIHQEYWKNYIIKNNLNNNDNNNNNNILLNTNPSSCNNNISRNKFNDNNEYFNSYESKVAFFLECLACCHNIIKFRDIIIGNLIDKMIFEDVNWDFEHICISELNYDTINNKNNNSKYLNNLSKFNSKQNILSSEKEQLIVSPSYSYNITDPNYIEIFNEYKVKELNSNNYNSINNNYYNNYFKLIIKKRFEFSSNYQLSASIVYNPMIKKHLIYFKGAIEKINKYCIASSLPNNISNVINEHNLNGKRLLSCAFRFLSEYEENNLYLCLDSSPYVDLDINENVCFVSSVDSNKYFNVLDLFKDLIFLGFVVFNNKLKKDTAEVINQLKYNDIKLAIATGDSAYSSIHIAKESNLIDKESQVCILDIDYGNDKDNSNNSLHIKATINNSDYILTSFGELVDSNNSIFSNIKYIDIETLEYIINYENYKTLEENEYNKDNSKFDINNNDNYDNYNNNNNNNENLNNSSMSKDLNFKKNYIKQDLLISKGANSNVLSVSGDLLNYILGSLININTQNYQDNDYDNNNKQIDILYDYTINDKFKNYDKVKAIYNSLKANKLNKNNNEFFYIKLLDLILNYCSIYFRMKPSDKVNLVKISKELGIKINNQKKNKVSYVNAIVSFCGDGANDVGAMMESDLGLCININESSMNNNSIYYVDNNNNNNYNNQDYISDLNSSISNIYGQQINLTQLTNNITYKNNNNNNNNNKSSTVINEMSYFNYSFHNNFHFYSPCNSISCIKDIIRCGKGCSENEIIIYKYNIIAICVIISSCLMLYSNNSFMTINQLSMLNITESVVLNLLMIK